MSSAAKPASLEVAQALIKVRDEIDEILETLEITSDKKLMREIQEGVKQAKRGGGVPIEELAKRLEKRH
jgi:hypothetical protein